MNFNKPNLFIVGAPKCGTSFLYEYLAKHPEVFMSKVKEPNYFDKDLHYTSRRLTLEEYLKLFKKADQKIAGEASPFYLYSKVACQEIYKFNPDSKIIIMLRDPVDMIQSLHGEHLFQGNEIEENLERAFELEEERKLGRSVCKHANPKEGVYYKDVCSYSEQVKRYLDVFGSKNVMIIFYEDLRSDAESIFNSVLHFLNVNSNFHPELKAVNQRKVIRSKEMRMLVKQPPELLKKVIQILLPVRSMRRYLQEKIIQLNSREIKRTTIDPSLALKIKTIMSPDIKNLEKLLGKDLSHWM